MTRARACTEEQFLKDVAAHELTVVRDDGVNRHLQFRRYGTFAYGFDIVTWPGYLAYTGDMGCYVFSRIPDMFEFFRASGHDWKDGKTIPINPHYWAEKIQAEDRPDGYEKYSPDKFKEVVARWLDEREASDDVRAAVQRQVLSAADDGEYAAHVAARNFDFEGFQFSDFWECNLREYTMRYLWCCYALVWGIRQYDERKMEIPA